MQTITTIDELRAALRAARQSGRIIGLVPTMGALHQGHLSLVDYAKKAGDFIVMTVFVNPIQFNNKEDLAKYPRTLDNDCALAESAGVDLLFAPSEAEMYPRGRLEQAGMTCRITAGDRAQGLCGATRPGHFDGVVTVVGILFNLIQPDVAVFGEKDYQQLLVLKQLNEDLHYGIEIIGAPIVRDADTLALSSRNVRLSREARKEALAIPGMLSTLAEEVRQGERSVPRLLAHGRELLTRAKGLSIDYLEIVHPETLKPISTIEGQAHLLVAAFVDDVRLIDNRRLTVG